MVASEKNQSYPCAQKYHINQLRKFLSGDKVKMDVFSGKHFHVVFVCLDDGYEIPPHYESYDVFFYIVSGRGEFTIGEERWSAGPGSMIFSPAGIRGIKCINRLAILGVQQPH
jgi:quercetin dioxygenase-like cupin family protein